MKSNKSVICIPYAGGSSYMYHGMKEELKNSGIMVRAIDLPGKGTRIEEPSCRTFSEAVNDCQRNLLEADNYSSTSIFGYSMGALLAFESVRNIYYSYQMLPAHLFIAACDSPQCYRKSHVYPWRDSDKFCEYLINTGGINADLAGMAEFKDFFLPIIRNDYMILETYQYHEMAMPIPIEADILYSSAECSIELWGDIFYRCNYHSFEGGHFFINDHLNEIEAVIINALYTK